MVGVFEKTSKLMERHQSGTNNRMILPLSIFRDPQRLSSLSGRKTDKEVPKQKIVE